MLSKYAKKVRRLLRQVYPTPQRIIKEVPLADFSKDIRLSKKTLDLANKYEARLGRMRVDFWVKHQVAIEVHGEQHEMEIKFSNDIEDTAAELIRRKGLDLVKQEVLKESGIAIVIVWYYEIADLTAEMLKEKIIAAQTISDNTVPKRIEEEKKQEKKDYKQKPYNKKNISKPLKARNNLSKANIASQSLISRPLKRQVRGQSKLSRDWERYKKEKDNG